jgi:hypothetical protein
MKNKAHLTEEGLDQIRKIKAGMNRGRKSFAWSYPKQISSLNQNFPSKFILKQIPYRAKLRLFSTLDTLQAQVKLDPYFVIGFIDTSTKSLVVFGRYYSINKCTYN